MLWQSWRYDCVARTGANLRKPSADVLTVYFDTSFWVRLREADADVARATIAELNEMRVRYVLSRLHIVELLAYRGEGLDVVADRATWFRLKPLVLDDDLDFEALRVPISLREAFLQEMEESSHAYARASAMALTARQTAEEKSRLAAQEQKPDCDAAIDFQKREQELHDVALKSLRSFGFLDEEGHLHLGKMMASFGFEEHSKHGTINILNPIPPTPERKKQLEQLSESILSNLSPSQLAWARERHELEDAAFKGDLRPHELVVGRASSEDARQVRNTGRDVDHMEVFIANAEAIDFFQLDARQNVALRTNPAHPLRRRELDSRCFHAGNLAKAVNQLRKMRNKMRNIVSGITKAQASAVETRRVELSEDELVSLRRVLLFAFEIAGEGTHACSVAAHQLGVDLNELTVAVSEYRQQAEQEGAHDPERLSEIAKELAAALRAFTRQLHGGQEQARVWYQKAMTAQKMLIRSEGIESTEIAVIGEALLQLAKSIDGAREMVRGTVDVISRIQAITLEVGFARDGAAAALESNEKFMNELIDDARSICELAAALQEKA